jgi:hypothetical protein
MGTSRYDESEILRLTPEIMLAEYIDIVDADLRDHILDVRFRIPGRDEIFGARLPMPESTLPMPFFFDVPEDETELLRMLRLWLEEETATGCAGWAVTVPADDALYFEVANYGFRRRDAAEHSRLTAAATGTWDYADVAAEMRT